MLVQAQNQKERTNERSQLSGLDSGNDEDVFKEDNAVNADNGQATNVSEVIKKFDEASVKDNDASGGFDVNGEPKLKNSESDLVMDNRKVIKMETDDEEDDANSKNINIDPRTYCKLGHFHLLLEDYPKGEFCLIIFIKICLSYTFLNFL